MAGKNDQRGRDARTGRFVPLKETQRRPSTTIKETVRKPPKKSK
jgi:hypothetical protein